MKNQSIDVKKEVLAGLTSFFAISYVIIVNSMILAEAGIPPQLSVFGTIIISVLGCLIMGLFGNVPIVITTGMGVNSFFTYTLVYSLKMSWQEALAASFCASLIYLVVAFTPLSQILIEAVPESLKHAITAGIGIFLVMVGLENGGIIVRGEHTFMELNSFQSPILLLTLASLILTLFLLFKNIQGSFFIGIIVTTLGANLFNLVPRTDSLFSLSAIKDYPTIVGKLDFSHIMTTEFILGTFSLAMILIFESMGLFNGLLPKMTDQEFKKAYRLNGIIMLFSSLLGTSPTIPAAESSTGIQQGGKTGKTAITVGLLFIVAFFAIPLLTYIPSSALAPVIIITGCLMMQNMQHIEMGDLSEWFPAFLMIVLMAFSMSISDGLAFGFVSYPIVKIFVGQTKQISKPMWLISFFFLCYLIAKVWI
ncbi:NCS2 family permease [Vagococcus intermedius]|uniref:NCS2 family permease n=1 Tax=Vagococcus intermedius TaxID=2991418 RepID=A0AAF0I7W1_9ENTE|nr:NCS2 family permease [Vagococcus intermedius]WEG73695.1 NCS2 family permease [Vagococcus intermedius]WEG75779.1 NCS2 family permease [Vagococcus intermedius]